MKKISSEKVVYSLTPEFFFVFCLSSLLDTFASKSRLVIRRFKVPADLNMARMLLYGHTSYVQLKMRERECEWEREKERGEGEREPLLFSLTAVYVDPSLFKSHFYSLLKSSFLLICFFRKTVKVHKLISVLSITVLFPRGWIEEKRSWWLK
jgi:hypothetical protein